MNPPNEYDSRLTRFKLIKEVINKIPASLTDTSYLFPQIEKLCKRNYVIFFTNFNIFKHHTNDQVWRMDMVRNQLYHVGIK